MTEDRPIPADNTTPASEPAQAWDEAMFAAAAERHRRELQVHCYRMLGSLEEAEDHVQETFLRAWRRRDSFEGRAPVRAWFYRIATNACLETLRRQPRATPRAGLGRLPPYSQFPWLQPYPDRLLDEATPAEEGPDALVVTKETIELAFLAAIQLLPPSQRAVLILRDVLAFSAAETASLLDTTVAGVNSALQRARATLRKFQQSSPPEVAISDPSEQERALVQRYMDAHERADPDAVIAVLRDDARLTISPAGLCWEGREAITPDYKKGFALLGDWRCVPTRANRHPAIAHYLRRPGDSQYRAFSLVVLGIQDGAIAEITTFSEPELFSAFGLTDTM